jgi:hypothetical protein
MLVDISIGIALSNIAVGLVFGLTWLNLYDEIRHSSRLQEEFRAAVRRLIGSVGLLVIPVAVYLIHGTRQSANNAEPFAFAWGACCVVSLLLLAAVPSGVWLELKVA